MAIIMEGPNFNAVRVARPLLSKMPSAITCVFAKRTGVGFKRLSLAPEKSGPRVKAAINDPS
jgi:hypothetical protein